MNDAGSTDEGDFHAAGLTRSRSGAKRKARLALAGLAVGAVLGLAGCSTPGPAHTYLYAPSVGQPTVIDIDPLTGIENARIPAFVPTGAEVLGLAYDPYTDHLFLRLSPGNVIHVVDRPAAKVKRVFEATCLPPGGHDLAIRSRDRHLFFSDPTGPVLIETDLYGKFQRRILLVGLAKPVWGVAYDLVTDEFIILPEKAGERLLRFSLAGEPAGALTLARPVQGGSLAYDAVNFAYYASLADGSAIGVFDPKGRLLRTLSRPAAEREVFIDIGPRSFLRLF